MTDTKEQLQAEREQLAARSAELGVQLAAGSKESDNHLLQILADRSHGQLARHKQSIDDAIYVIDQRVQLIDVTTEIEASLQELAPVE